MKKKIIIILALVAAVSVSSYSQEKINEAKATTKFSNFENFVSASFVFEELWNKKLESEEALTKYLSWKSAFEDYFSEAFISNILLNEECFPSEVIERAKVLDRLLYIDHIEDTCRAKTVTI